MFLIVFSQFLTLILNSFFNKTKTGLYYCLRLSEGFTNAEGQILMSMFAWKSSLHWEESCIFKAYKNSV